MSCNNGEKNWKVDYKLYGTRIAKGLGSSPDEANNNARKQLEEKKLRGREQKREQNIKGGV
jgi:hypothetical protein